MMLPLLLYAAVRAAVPDGTTINTVATGAPNHVIRIGREGAWVVTEKSQADGSGAQLVEAWMLQAAWEHLEQHGSLTQTFLLADDGLNVKRSAAVIALLAQLPGVRVASTSPVRLELDL